MVKVGKVVAASALVVTAFAVSGCASSDQMSSMDSRISQLEQQQSANTMKINELESKIDQAAMDAADAKKAAMDASESSKRVEAMFKKSMMK
jgi:outer membrane murein-binding lipoprotein Lpp